MAEAVAGLTFWISYAWSRLSTTGRAAWSVMWAPERLAAMKWCAIICGVVLIVAVALRAVAPLLAYR